MPMKKNTTAVGDSGRVKHTGIEWWNFINTVLNWISSVLLSNVPNFLPPSALMDQILVGNISQEIKRRRIQGKLYYYMFFLTETITNIKTDCFALTA
jgi:hypothetical protein